MPKSATLLLIRHAEKSGDPDDAGLTPAGQARAQAYVAYFQALTLDSARIAAPAWLIAKADEAESRRARLTLEPLAAALGLPIDTDLGEDQHPAAGPTPARGGALRRRHHAGVLVPQVPAGAGHGAGCAEVVVAGRMAGGRVRLAAAPGLRRRRRARRGDAARAAVDVRRLRHFALRLRAPSQSRTRAQRLHVATTPDGPSCLSARRNSDATTEGPAVDRRRKPPVPRRLAASNGDGHGHPRALIATTRRALLGIGLVAAMAGTCARPAASSIRRSACAPPPAASSSPPAW